MADIPCQRPPVPVVCDISGRNTLHKSMFNIRVDTLREFFENCTGDEQYAIESTIDQ